MPMSGWPTGVNTAYVSHYQTAPPIVDRSQLMYDLRCVIEEVVNPVTVKNLQTY